MVEQTQTNLEEALRLLEQDPVGMPTDQRRQLVTAISDAILCEGASDEKVVGELVDLLARDPDWEVRLDVARMLHLLDDEPCTRLVAALRRDCNRYVRNHAERSLARQRKARKTSNRRCSEFRTYAGQLDQLARQYGRRVAAKVESLADQRYAMMAAAVAHDVRSILTTLLANAAVLAERRDVPGRAESVLQDGGLIQRTIEAMEQFTRPLPVQRQREDLREMIHQAVDKAREAVIQQGHDISAVETVVTSAPAIRLRVSRRLIVLALTNLIENAIESFAERDVDTLRPGRVEVQVIVDCYETRILVRDNGTGMEPEVLNAAAAFVPMGTNKAKRSSSGWGLTLVNRYVSAHGGSVTIDSEMDRGTTAAMALPMRDPQEAEEE